MFYKRKNAIFSSCKKIFNRAKEEFENSNGNDLKIRQAAEKARLACVQATNALLLKKNIKPPKGTRKREEILSELEKKDKKINQMSSRHLNVGLIVCKHKYGSHMTNNLLLCCIIKLK